MTIETTPFEGPLELLLQLVEAKERDITEIALASVAEQFLHSLEAVEKRQPDVLADFLVVATKLLLLKSHALLPYLHVEEEEHPEELATQLKMYKQYAQAAQEIAARIVTHTFLYSRKTIKIQHAHFAPPLPCDARTLRDAFRDICTTLASIVQLPRAAVARVVSLRETLCRIQALLEKKIRTHFHSLLENVDDRQEVVVTFLALLELVKQQAVCVQQPKPFGNIVVEKSSA